MSGYSRVTPGSHSKTGQHMGKSAVLLVLSESLHLGLGLGRGPQSSTNSQRRPCWAIQVDFPQKGLSSQVAPGSKVAHRVEAKQVPGKSVVRINLVEFRSQKFPESLSSDAFCLLTSENVSGDESLVDTGPFSGFLVLGFLL